MRTPTKRLRQELDWDQKTLSEKSGVPRSTISRFERRMLTPNAANLLKIANALGVEPWELLDDPSLAPDGVAS